MVVVGGGFGGLLATRGLKGAPVEVTLVDRQNFHLFQPLAYQVATGALSPAEIAVPLRSVLKRQKNAHVLLAEVAGFDLDARQVVVGICRTARAAGCFPTTRSSSRAGRATRTSATTSGAIHAPELKSLDGALEIRNRILLAFEAAEVERDRSGGGAG